MMFEIWLLMPLLATEVSTLISRKSPNIEPSTLRNGTFSTVSVFVALSSAVAYITRWSCCSAPVLVTQVVIASLSGRGRSGGALRSVPIWISPAIRS